MCPSLPGVRADVERFCMFQVINILYQINRYWYRASRGVMAIQSCGTRHGCKNINA